MPYFTLLGVSCSLLFLEMAKILPFYGQNMVLQIGSSWILIIVPRDVTCPISHCWVFPVAPLPKNGQKWPFYGQNMVHTWSGPLWPKHGPQIGSSWILINVPRYVPCQISRCWVYHVAPSPRNGLNMALFGQNMAIDWNRSRTRKETSKHAKWSHELEFSKWKNEKKYLGSQT